MKTNAVICAVLATTVLVGCQGGYATRSYTPVIDAYGSSGKHPDQYPADLAACQQLGEQVNQIGDAAKAGGVGALVGAGGGAIGGSIHGGGKVAEGAGLGALAGLLGGAVYGGIESNRARQDVVIACLRNRGWSVLGR